MLAAHPHHPPPRKRPASPGSTLRAVFAAALITFTLLSPAAAEPFQFQIPDGTVLTARAHREITTESTGGNKEVNTEDTVSEWRFRKSPSGCDLAITQQSAVRTVNGQPFRNSAADSVLLGRTLITQLDANGRFIRLTGHEGLIAEMKKKFPQARPALIEATLAPALLETAQRRTWWLHAARLLSHEAAAGTRWQERQDSPGQTPPATWSLNIVTETKPDAPRPLTTVLAFLSSDPGLLQKLETATPQSLADPEVQAFITWNVGNLPLQKIALRQTLDATTLQPTEEETITIRVSTIPTGLQTQTDKSATTWEAVPSAASPTAH